MNHLQTFTFVAILALSVNAPGFAQADSQQEKAARITAEAARRQQEEAAANARREGEEHRRRVEQDEAKRKAAYPLTPLSVQVVVSRYRGEKKVSSLPYMLSVNANSLRWGGKPAQLRMGGQIPITQRQVQAGDGKPMPGMPITFQYKDIGTNIDVTADSVEGGRFRVNVLIEDSSIYAEGTPNDVGPPVVKDMPVFRSFRASNELILSSGQSVQFTAATDRVSGEVIKIDVSMTVVK